MEPREERREQRRTRGADERATGRRENRKDTRKNNGATRGRREIRVDDKVVTLRESFLRHEIVVIKNTISNLNRKFT